MRVSRRVGGVLAVVLAFVSVSMGVGVLGATPGYAAPLGSNQQAVFDWFVSQGLPAVATAGLVGNLDYESGGVNPKASQCGSSEVAPPGGYCGVGIAQWTWGQNSGANRWQDLVGFAKIKGESGVTFGTTDPNSFPSLSVQAQFVWQELNTTHRPVLAQLRACSTRGPVLDAIKCATYAVQRGYEVPQNAADENPNPGCASPPNFCNRYADAVALYQTYAPPSEPLGLKLSGANASEVALSWYPSPGSSGYRVLRNGVPVASTTTTRYTDTGLRAGTSYTYTVAGTNSSGISVPSPALTAITAPAAPSLSASASALTYVGGAVTLFATAAGATAFNYSYASTSGALPIKGWLPKTWATGRARSVRLDVPPNSSTQPKTYAVTASATNSGGTSEPETIAITVRGKNPSKPIAKSVKDRVPSAGYASKTEGPSSRFVYQLTNGRFPLGQPATDPAPRGSR
ncbi:MAG: hypothetical protein J2P58_03540 [Acidimicrobiaceae bacterium]|nr:hypothetical protein [Acidimicrobiaceae bacterium]